MALGLLPPERAAAVAGHAKRSQLTQGIRVAEQFCSVSRSNPRMRRLRSDVLHDRISCCRSWRRTRLLPHAASRGPLLLGSRPETARRRFLSSAFEANRELDLA